MIKDALKNAISSLSEKHNLAPTDLRIKISKPEKKLEYHIMNKGDIIQETNLATALNLNTMVAFMVGNKLSAIMESLVSKYKIAPDKINVRIYTKSEDCSPLLYLFDGSDAKEKIDLESLT